MFPIENRPKKGIQESLKQVYTPLSTNSQQVRDLSKKDPTTPLKNIFHFHTKNGYFSCEAKALVVEKCVFSHPGETYKQ